MNESSALRSAFLFAILGLAAWYDFRYRRIPNWLSLAGLGVALLFLLIAGAREEWESAGWGFVIGVFSMLLLYIGGGVGGGDVKLMAGVGLLASYPDVIYLLFFGCVIALLLIVVRLIWKGVFWPVFLSGLLFWKKRESKPQGAGEGVKRKENAGEMERELRSVSLAFALALGFLWVRILEFF